MTFFVYSGFGVWEAALTLSFAIFPTRLAAEVVGGTKWRWGLSLKNQHQEDPENHGHNEVTDSVVILNGTLEKLFCICHSEVPFSAVVSPVVVPFEPDLQLNCVIKVDDITWLVVDVVPRIIIEVISEQCFVVLSVKVLLTEIKRRRCQRISVISAYAWVKIPSKSFITLFRVLCFFGRESLNLAIGGYLQGINV